VPLHGILKLKLGCSWRQVQSNVESVELEKVAVRLAFGRGRTAVAAFAEVISRVRPLLGWLNPRGSRLRRRHRKIGGQAGIASSAAIITRVSRYHPPVIAAVIAARRDRNVKLGNLERSGPREFLLFPITCSHLLSSAVIRA